MEDEKLVQPETVTQDEKYLTSSFEEMTIGTFFYHNGCLCIKINEKFYLKYIPNRNIVEIVKYNEDFKTAIICNIEFAYKLRNS